MNDRVTGEGEGGGRTGGQRNSRQKRTSNNGRDECWQIGRDKRHSPPPYQHPSRPSHICRTDENDHAAGPCRRARMPRTHIEESIVGGQESI